VQIVAAKSPGQEAKEASAGFSVSANGVAKYPTCCIAFVGENLFAEILLHHFVPPTAACSGLGSIWMCHSCRGGWLAF